MQFTSKAIAKLGEINGPRCCKRDAKIAFKYGVEYVNSHYEVKLNSTTKILNANIQI